MHLVSFSAATAAKDRARFKDEFEREPSEVRLVAGSFSDVALAEQGSVWPSVFGQAGSGSHAYRIGESVRDKVHPAAIGALENALRGAGAEVLGDSKPGEFSGARTAVIGEAIGDWLLGHGAAYRDGDATARLSLLRELDYAFGSAASRALCIAKTLAATGDLRRVRSVLDIGGAHGFIDLLIAAAPCVHVDRVTVVDRNAASREASAKLWQAVEQRMGGSLAFKLVSLSVQDYDFSDPANLIMLNQSVWRIPELDRAAVFAKMAGSPEPWKLILVNEVVRGPASGAHAAQYPNAVFQDDLIGLLEGLGPLNVRMRSSDWRDRVGVPREIEPSVWASDTIATVGPIVTQVVRGRRSPGKLVHPRSPRPRPAKGRVAAGRP